jgi:hypothetical protein
MSRTRYTLAQLMALVLFLALGFAALRNANELWASLSFTVAIITIAAAPLLAWVRTGRERLTWTGYAVFRWTCVVVEILAPPGISGPFAQIPRPTLLFSLVLSQLPEYIMPSAGLSVGYLQVCHSLGIILFGVLGAIVGRFIPLKGHQPGSGSQ